MAYSTISKPSLHFNTKLYTGNGGTQSITGVGFPADFIWVKARDGATNYYHYLQDIVRGTQKILYSNTNDAEATITAGINTVGSDGWTTGSQGALNDNGDNFVAWNWKANGQGSSNTDGSINTTYTSVNSTAGFSISKYTGTGSNATFGHGLGVKPDMFIIKRLNAAEDWATYHQSMTASYYLNLNLSQAQQSNNRFNGEPDTSVIKLQTHAAVNGSGDTYICYAFANKKGYSRFGTYTGNGNADGTFVYTGFKPAWVLTKETSNTSSWDMHDNKRDSFNVCSKHLLAEDNGLEGNTVMLDLVSNGFKFRSSNGDRNQSGATYIYMALAEEPLVANVGASIPATAR